MAICVATISYVAFGASMALGAFLGGMVVGQSKVSDQAAEDVLPMRNAFAVLFFVAVGMLFNYRAVLESPGLFIGVIGIILVVKPLAALAIVIVAAAIASISLNALVFRRMLALEPVLARNRLLARWMAGGGQKLGAGANEVAPERMQDPGAVVVGHGPVGQTVTRLLAEFKLNPMIIESNVDVVLELQGRGRQALFGDASRHDILRAARVDAAAYLIVTVPQAEVSLRIIQAAREVAPAIRVLARAEYINQSEAFLRAGAAIVRYDEAESAATLAEALLQDIDVPVDRIDALVSHIRNELAPSRPGRSVET